VSRILSTLATDRVNTADSPFFKFECHPANLQGTQLWQSLGVLYCCLSLVRLSTYLCPSISADICITSLQTFSVPGSMYLSILVSRFFYTPVTSCFIKQSSVHAVRRNVRRPLRTPPRLSMHRNRSNPVLPHVGNAGSRPSPSKQEMERSSRPMARENRPTRGQHDQLPHDPTHRTFAAPLDGQHHLPPRQHLHPSLLDVHLSRCPGTLLHPRPSRHNAGSDDKPERVSLDVGKLEHSTRRLPFAYPHCLDGLIVAQLLWPRWRNRRRLDPCCPPLHLGKGAV